MDFLGTDDPDQDELIGLYNAVGWNAYTAVPESLSLAIANSTYLVTARDKGELVGLARGISDDVSIFYLQDLLVRPAYRGKGVGRRLIEMSLEKHSHVRQTVLMTDSDENIHDLYRSLGLRAFPTEDGLIGFVRTSGLK